MFFGRGDARGLPLRSAIIISVRIFCDGSAWGAKGLRGVLPSASVPQGQRRKSQPAQSHETDSLVLSLPMPALAEGIYGPRTRAAQPQLENWTHAISQIGCIFLVVSPINLRHWFILADPNGQQGLNQCRVTRIAKWLLEPFLCICQSEAVRMTGRTCRRSIYLPDQLGRGS